MFSFVKNLTKKKNISTATMTSDEYMCAVEDGIIAKWEDKVLMEKTGIKNLFDQNAKISKVLSYEDACDCAYRAVHMISMGEYVCDEFHRRSNALDDECERALAEHMQSVKNGKRPGKFIFENELYSADTIRDLFVEAQTKAIVDDYSQPANLDEAIKRIEEVIATFVPVKTMLFSAIVCFAKSNNADMVGYIK